MLSFECIKNEKSVYFLLTSAPCFGQLSRGAGLCCPINFLAGSFFARTLGSHYASALVLTINFLAVVLSGLFWATSPRYWPWLPIKLPRGDVFRLVLGSSSAVLDFAAH